MLLEYSTHTHRTRRYHSLHDAAYKAADVASLAYRDAVTGLRRPSYSSYVDLPKYDPNNDLSFSGTAQRFPSLQMPEKSIFFDYDDHLSSSDESAASEGEED